MDKKKTLKIIIVLIIFLLWFAGVGVSFAFESLTTGEKYGVEVDLLYAIDEAGLDISAIYDMLSATDDEVSATSMLLNNDEKFLSSGGAKSIYSLFMNSISNIDSKKFATFLYKFMSCERISTEDRVTLVKRYLSGDNKKKIEQLSSLPLVKLFSEQDRSYDDIMAIRHSLSSIPYEGWLAITLGLKYLYEGINSINKEDIDDLFELIRNVSTDVSIVAEGSVLAILDGLFAGVRIASVVFLQEEMVYQLSNVVKAYADTFEIADVSNVAGAIQKPAIILLDDYLASLDRDDTADLILDIDYYRAHDSMAKVAVDISNRIYPLYLSMDDSAKDSICILLDNILSVLDMNITHIDIINFADSLLGYDARDMLKREVNDVDTQIQKLFLPND